MSASSQRTTPTEGEVIDFPVTGASSSPRRLSPKPQSLDWPLRLPAEPNVSKAPQSAGEAQTTYSKTTELEPIAESQPLFAPLGEPAPERTRFTMDDLPPVPAPRKPWANVFKKTLFVTVLIATAAATAALFT